MTQIMMHDPCMIRAEDMPMAMRNHTRATHKPHTSHAHAIKTQCTSHAAPARQGCPCSPGSREAAAAPAHHHGHRPGGTATQKGRTRRSGPRSARCDWNWPPRTTDIMDHGGRMSALDQTRRRNRQPKESVCTSHAKAVQKAVQKVVHKACGYAFAQTMCRPCVGRHTPCTIHTQSMHKPCVGAGLALTRPPPRPPRPEGCGMYCMAPARGDWGH